MQKPPIKGENMEIINHRLKDTPQIETPNIGGIIEPRYLVFHFTAGRSAQTSIDWFCNPSANASAHLIVGRDGSIYQLAPFNIRTWHAGKSDWDGLSGLNSYSIGIEMDNPGKLTKAGSKYLSWFQAEYPEDEVLHAKHRYEDGISWWHTYTEIQIEKALDLAIILVKSYNLKEIIGHEDISRGRKNDPGPAFPLVNICSKVFGRAEDQSPAYEVAIDSLNIRKGPGIEYDPVSSPLLRGTRVSLLQKVDRWSMVDVEGPNDVEGWVRNKYLSPIAS
jgi:N-acetylmuramoyl-L-alanine amidase